MAERPRILIAGGSGVFGRLLARELLDTTAARLVLAGRDRHRLAARRALGQDARVEALSLDLADRQAFAQAVPGCFAVACAAGPFQSLDAYLPAATIAAGAHWLDIADDPDWVLPLLANAALNADATARGLLVMPGLSSVPALSGMLVRCCLARLPAGDRARITLAIGNRNAKGAGAIAAALAAGLRDPRPVRLPVGTRAALLFRSPDAALLRQEHGITAEFRVAFELHIAGRLLAPFARLSRRLPPAARLRLARALALVSAPLSRFGTDAGCLQAELWDGHGGHAAAALMGHGQRMAVLPCALALETLLSGHFPPAGVVRPAGWMAPDEWIARLQARGIVCQEWDGGRATTA